MQSLPHLSAHGNDTIHSQSLGMSTPTALASIKCSSGDGGASAGSGGSSGSGGGGGNAAGPAGLYAAMMARPRPPGPSLRHAWQALPNSARALLGVVLVEAAAWLAGVVLNSALVRADAASGQPNQAARGGCCC